LGRLGDLWNSNSEESRLATGKLIFKGDSEPGILIAVDKELDANNTVVATANKAVKRIVDSSRKRSEE
jgi:hypothetical protein